MWVTSHTWIVAHDYYCPAVFQCQRQFFTQTRNFYCNWVEVEKFPSNECLCHISDECLRLTGGREVAFQDVSSHQPVNFRPVVLMEPRILDAWTGNIAYISGIFS